MYDVIALICFLGLIAMFLLKLVNLMNQATFYDKKYVWVTMAITALLFVMYYVSFWTSIGYVETITDSTGDITITTNEYVSLLNYSYVAWLMLVLAGILTVLEQIYAFPQYINPKMGRNPSVMPKFSK